jgi:tRNA(Phe) wybutosine-synthesizing methylase Tyw3
MNTNKLNELKALAESAGFQTTTLKHTHSTILNIKIDAERSFVIEAIFDNGSVRHIAENVFFYFGSRTSIKKILEFLTSKIAA